MRGYALRIAAVDGIPVHGELHRGRFRIAGRYQFD
jgi:hypothetical protein